MSASQAALVSFGKHGCLVVSLAASPNTQKLTPKLLTANEEIAHLWQ
ncbi:MAG TPA: hypothetical protein V6C78_05230 [Crinalium sp.]